MVTFGQCTSIARHVMCRINAYFSSVTPHNVDVIPLVTFMTVLEFYALTLFSPCWKLQQWHVTFQVLLDIVHQLFLPRMMTNNYASLICV
jgi:hypothetical protein